MNKYEQAAMEIVAKAMNCIPSELSQLGPTVDFVKECALRLELQAALDKIANGDGPGCRQCPCDDHSDPDCCNNCPTASEYFCPTCIAGAALQKSRSK